MAEKTKKQEIIFGLEENVACALTYVVGWVTAIVFLLMEKKNSKVRFHAMQSLIFFAGLQIIMMTPLLVFGFILLPLGFIVWLVCIIKAYNGEMFELPIIGKFAKKQLKKM